MNSNAKVEMVAPFAGDGFEIVGRVIPHHECDLLLAELMPLFEEHRKEAKSKIGGVRNLLRPGSRVAQCAVSAAILPVLERRGCPAMFPVRAIFFDKSPEANWLVPWHQDLAIAVTERIETPGFSGWSIKEGALHVQPPREILESMIAVRLHLDDCDAGSGALKVIPGSHLFGKLEAVQIDEWTRNARSVVCEVPRGGALLMRPLLLHSSSPAMNPSHRRVLHIEYATQELPNGLKWLKS